MYIEHIRVTDTKWQVNVPIVDEYAERLCRLNQIKTAWLVNDDAGLLLGVAICLASWF